MVGRNPDTLKHCQVCGAKLPRRSHSNRRRELCQSHNSAVNCIVRAHKVSVELATGMVTAEVSAQGRFCMNRTKIEWTDWTWNPITGCKHGCWYCYAKKLTQRFKKIFPNGFEPTFHPERLKEPWDHKKPSKIFVCSIADLFAPWTPQIWKERVWDSMLFCPVKHTFQLLTKNPENIPKTLAYPENFWFGTTVTMENSDWKNIEEIKKVNARVKFVSFEPLLGLLPSEISFDGLQWVIIGKLTGSKRVKLDSYWVARILNEARDHGIPVFIKNNVGWPVKIQEFPNEAEK